MPRPKRMTPEAEQILRDTLRYAKQRGYGLHFVNQANGRARLVVRHPVSRDSTSVAYGYEDELVPFLEFWLQLVVTARIKFDDPPVRASVACFLRDVKATKRLSTLDRKANEVWRRKEWPEYYKGVRA